MYLGCEIIGVDFWAGQLILHLNAGTLTDSWLALRGHEVDLNRLVFDTAHIHYELPALAFAGDAQTMKILLARGANPNAKSVFNMHCGGEMPQSGGESGSPVIRRLVGSQIVDKDVIAEWVLGGGDIGALRSALRDLVAEVETGKRFRPEDSRISRNFYELHCIY